MWLSLLPGVRDLRTPLINGYVWLAAVWVALSEWHAIPDTKKPFSHHLDALLGLGGPTTRWLVLSFAAYIVGGLLSVRSLGPGTRDDAPGMRRPSLGFLLRLVNLPVTLTRLARDANRDSAQSRNLLRWAREQVQRVDLAPTVAGRVRVDRELPADLRRRLADAWEEDDPEEPVSRVIASWIARQEIGTLRIRLRLEREALFQDQDRLVSESELRCSIWFPLAILVFEAGAWQSPWLWLAGAVPLALLMDGLQLDNQSREILYEALSYGEIQSPTMTRIRELAESTSPAASNGQVVALPDPLADRPDRASPSG